MCVLGTKKEDKKCSTSEEGTLFREQKSFIILALFPLFFCSQKEGSRSRRQRAESFFHLFFCASFSTHCSLFFLSLLFSLFFSLSFLSSSLCVFLLENSLHTNNFLAAAQAPIIILIFPLIIKVNTTTRKARFT